MVTTLVVRVDAARAVRAGRTVSGDLPVAISDEQIASLSDAQREALATRLEGSPPHIIGAAEATWEAVVVLLQSDLADAQAREEAAVRAAAEYRDRCEYVVRERVTIGDAAEGSLVADWPAGPYLGAEREAGSGVGRVWAEISARPEVAAWIEDLAQRNRVCRAERKAREEAVRHDRQVRRQAKREAEQRFDEAQHELVLALGSPDQREREEAGLLPEAERAAILHGYLFAGLAAFPRYERLGASDASHTPECVCDRGEVSYGSDDESEATADQWAALSAVRAAAPAGATAVLRWHGVDCSSCGSRKGVRWSIRVTIAWHGHDLTREYAAPAGVCPEGSESV